MSVGRPTKYTPELVARAWEYVNGGWKDVGDPMPSVVGLVDELNIDRSTAYDWAAIEGSEFSYILGRVNVRQERCLLRGGLKNELNANIAKLVLGKHGYSEKTDNTLSGPNGGAIEVDQKWEVEFINAPD